MKLAKFTKQEEKKITVTLPGNIANNVEEYRQFYAETYGDSSVTTNDIIVEILAAFIQDDKAFQKRNRAK